MPGSMTSTISMAGVTMRAIKDLWETFMMYNERVAWNNSPERRALATERIEALRRGENP